MSELRSILYYTYESTRQDEDEDEDDEDKDEDDVDDIDIDLGQIFLPTYPFHYAQPIPHPTTSSRVMHKSENLRIDGVIEDWRYLKCDVKNKKTWKQALLKFLKGTIQCSNGFNVSVSCRSIGNRDGILIGGPAEF
ncbi:hypothetical protein V1478_004111 [Vespula squamosa]|uniref:Uncharacterized protein n=1 Tax=Vespula squamosa TaxID=30214 RepID=A0ABD2BNQ3_VESSQ